MGLTVSPNAMGVGSVSTQAKVPLFITNASALGILEKNPYAARFSYNEAQLTYPLAQWALKNGLKKVVSMCYRAETFQTETALDPLRGRDDFQMLLAQIKALIKADAIKDK